MSFVKPILVFLVFPVPLEVNFKLDSGVFEGKWKGYSKSITLKAVRFMSKCHIKLIHCRHSGKNVDECSAGGCLT